jgi:predicted nucleotidyltransferase component of viral defense system
MDTKEEVELDEPESSSIDFALLDIILRPKDIYKLIDALYEITPYYVDEQDEDVQHTEELIAMFNSALEHAGLPLEVEEYESPSLHPEETSWKQLGIFSTEEQN